MHYNQFLQIMPVIVFLFFPYFVFQTWRTHACRMQMQPKKYCTEKNKIRKECPKRRTGFIPPSNLRRSDLPWLCMGNWPQPPTPTLNLPCRALLLSCCHMLLRSHDVMSKKNLNINIKTFRVELSFFAGRSINWRKKIKRISFLLKYIFKKCIWKFLNTMFLSQIINILIKVFILSDEYIDQLT